MTRTFPYVAAKQKAYVTQLARESRMMGAKPVFNVFPKWFSALRVGHPDQIWRRHHTQYPALAGAAWLDEVSHIVPSVFLVVHHVQQAAG
jgi:hypothetical protein